MQALQDVLALQALQSVAALQALQATKWAQCNHCRPSCQYLYRLSGRPANLLNQFLFIGIPLCDSHGLVRSNIMAA